MTVSKNQTHEENVCIGVDIYMQVSP